MSQSLGDYFEIPLNFSTKSLVIGLGGLGVCGVSSYFALQKIKDHQERRRLRELIDRKQKERTETFDRLRLTYELNTERKSIVELPVDVLLQKLQARELSSVKVLEAYIAKALEVTDAYNCVTEFVPQALAWAQDLDKSPEPVGPLHGLPIAIKDDTNIEGMDSTLGYASNLFNPAKESSVFVLSMRQLGAIPFCKTNMPQSLLSCGSDNPIFGTTRNPLNPKLTPGGSSSGSGCIVGAGAAPVAEGTDLGGSGRIPAHCCGTAAIRPTLGRLSGKGIVQALPNMVGMSGVASVLAKNSNTVATVFKGLTTDGLQNKLDPLAVPIPWRDEIFTSTQPLRIGFFTSVPVLPAIGDTESVVISAKTVLESLGHTLIPFELPDSYNYAMTASDFYLADDGKGLLEHLKNEEPSCAMETTVAALKTPHYMRKFQQFLASQPWLPFFYSKRAQHFSAGGARVKKSYQLWKTRGRQIQIIKEIVNQMEEKRLDLILGPVFPFPAIEISAAGKLLLAALSYTALWNLVDFPAGVVPFDKESGSKFDKYDNEGDNLLKLVQEVVKDSIGMPIGVTLVGKPFQEELVLRVMVELEEAKRL